MAQPLFQRNNGSPMGFGQPHKRLASAILRPPTEQGYGQAPPQLVPPGQLPAAPRGVSPTPAPSASPLRGIPTGLYSAPPPPPVAPAFPAAAAYNQLQQAILQGQVSTPMPAAPDPMADPDYARMLDFLQQQTLGGF